MAHPYHHALSSVRRFGGAVEDYQPIHDWFDGSKAFHAGAAHRALRHHAEGIWAAQHEFGVTVTTADGKKVPVRLIGEQHVIEDLGFIPSLSDWLKHLSIEPWMHRSARKLSRELSA
ncbi:hypothetical protein ASE69_07710 [Sphingomonas sp. Leaf208]|uniref:DUF6915 family protein n=1 Tax=Sphingomonas sp. Leaf208 TaxID=1735679 RepID=UPI0006FE63D4|nr:hypothetical protein [Sphingomonas sp. Leaf208]KQM51193.1 hypothetical protein ASE69_07710 [Sphingomonas sp. Leaf208]